MLMEGLMVIEKILNNNVVVIKDKCDVEKIVMGRGIAFQKKTGDSFDESKIDKVFALTSEEAANKFQELIVDIPIEHIELAEEVISYAKLHLGKKLNDMLYISLVDHIYTSIVRFQDGIVVKNALLWDIRRFYPDEYRIGTKALDMIENTFKIRLPEDEAGFIALHLVNAEMDEENIQNMYDITKVMQDVTNIVKYFFHIEFDENSVYYYRFITHLKFFAQRLVSNQTYQDGNDDDLLEVIKIKYKNAYECVCKVTDYIFKKYNYVLSNEEKLYLTIHIERVIYKTEK